MIRSYSQRLTPPFSGQVQITESERARAVSIDNLKWEFHFFIGIEGDVNSTNRATRKRFMRVATFDNKEVMELADPTSSERSETDDRIIELADYISSTKLPYDAADRFEYWLLEPKSGSPMALIFSCVEEEFMETFPNKTEWTALPAAIMPIERSEEELANGLPPVNYRVERLINDHAGYKPQASWFVRNKNDEEFPPFLVKEDWEDESEHLLCQRYINRQAPRLLMLHELSYNSRSRLESSAKENAIEVERFHQLYPSIADKNLMNSILVEAKIRQSNKVI